MKAIQYAYDQKFGKGKGWDYGVLFPTVRRVRQACGRVVRSPSDYGIRVLADARFTHASVAKMKRFSIHMQFPDDERREFVDVKPEKVKFSMMNFFGDIKGNGMNVTKAGDTEAMVIINDKKTAPVVKGVNSQDVKSEAVKAQAAKAHDTAGDKGLEKVLTFTTMTLRKKEHGK
jgi:hypothetical protein